MHEFNFLIPVPTIDEVIYFSNISLHKNWQIFSVGYYAWSLQTYLILKDHGLPVYLDKRFHRKRINIGFGRTLGKLWKQLDVFVVDIKADVPKDYWGRNIQIVQNKAAENRRKKSFYISHWPQAGLIKRDSERKIVNNVAYAGRINNLLSGKGNLKEVVNRLGMNFKVLDQTNWNDFSKIDICIGIRSFDKNPHRNKPATKLYNAWHAHVPFIGGYESAFEQTGKPGINYLRVLNEDELVLALIKLRDNSDFYNYFVENGKNAKELYNYDTIAQEWINFLENIAVPEYQKWKAQSPFFRTRKIGANIAIAMLQNMLRFPRSLPNVIARSIKNRLAKGA